MSKVKTNNTKAIIPCVVPVNMPWIGELVRAEYLIIDELEVTCWVSDYNVIGYLDNSDMKVKMEDLDQKVTLEVNSIIYDRIELRHSTYSSFKLL